MRKPFGVVYEIRCEASGKSYIGITTQTVKRRWQAHVQRAIKNDPSGVPVLSAAIRKYGATAFTVEAIASCMDADALVEAEKEIIRSRGTLVPLGYNRSPGGDAPSVDPETKAKMRAAHLGKKQSPETIKKRADGQRGRKQSLGHIEKRIRPQRGVKRESWGRHTEASRALMAMRIKEKAQQRGYRYDAETRRARSERMKGKKQSAEWVANRAAGMSRWAATEAGRRHMDRIRRMGLEVRRATKRRAPEQLVLL